MPGAILQGGERHPATLGTCRLVALQNIQRQSTLKLVITENVQDYGMKFDANLSCFAFVTIGCGAQCPAVKIQMNDK